MTSDMLAADRRQAIIERLCERRHDTRMNLVREFHVCRRTIEKDLAYLSLIYPIYTTSGYKGGIHVMDGFYLKKPPHFNQEQLDLLEKLYQSLTGKEKDIMAGIIKFGGGRITDESVWFCSRRWECLSDSEVHCETND